jgi:uncharacterized protein (UPF0332 family)
VNDLSEYQLIVRKAIRSIDAARRNFDDKDYDFASSRAYYAAFYVMQAALLTKGLSFSKHIRTHSFFSDSNLQILFNQEENR